MNIVIKTPAEIEKMRVAGRLAAEVLEMIEAFVKVGVSTNELDKICHDYIVNEQKAIPACLGYQPGGFSFAFPKSICTSVNYVVCHGVPNERKLKLGDIVNIDVTVIKDGYHGDTSKMYLVGKSSPATIAAERLCRITQECLYKGIAVVKPGTYLGDIGAVIQQHAEAHHYSVVREYCGHGIGREFHEDPQVLHYGRPKTGVVLEPGMTFTIEPMINKGTREIKGGKKEHGMFKDAEEEWKVVTADKQLSAQYEHTLLVTETGVEVLTLRKEEAEALGKFLTP